MNSSSNSEGLNSAPTPAVAANIEPPDRTHGSEKWSSGLFDCCEDRTNCCMTLCCPFITFGQNVDIIDRGQSSMGEAVGIFFILDSFGCAFIRSFPYRAKLRAQYSLPEEPCGDCCVHCCCIHCALCQEYRELKSRGLDPSLGWAGNMGKVNQTEGVPPVVEPSMAR